jgi:hypothetical protein
MLHRAANDDNGAMLVQTVSSVGVQHRVSGDTNDRDGDRAVHEELGVGESLQQLGVATEGHPFLVKVYLVDDREHLKERDVLLLTLQPHRDETVRLEAIVGGHSEVMRTQYPVISIQSSGFKSLRNSRLSVTANIVISHQIGNINSYSIISMRF